MNSLEGVAHLPEEEVGFEQKAEVEWKRKKRKKRNKEWGGGRRRKKKEKEENKEGGCRMKNEAEELEA